MADQTTAEMVKYVPGESKAISVRLKLKELERFNEACERVNLNGSQVLRGLVRKWMQSGGSKARLGNVDAA